MRSFIRLFPLVLALSACSTAVGPAPTPTPTPSQPVVTRTVPARVEVMPERWWLLDVEADGVYGAGVDRAYREILNAKQPRRSITVAIIDSGVDVAHEDLDGVLWSNPREQSNSRDDDNNSYADDLRGWNFIGGRDGRNVDHDTYEVTRLFAACEKLYGSRPRTPAPVERPTQQECTTITADFRERREENQGMIDQVRQIAGMVDTAVAVLKRQLRTENLTEANVRALTPPNSNVAQAQRIYLGMLQQGITQKMIAEEMESITGLLQYGLNPEFDPRPIVGDNYANPTEKGYGNADVTGPDAGHGTGVAGIVAAERTNGLGVEGVAVNVRIMPIRAVPDGDERDKDVANAIRYAVDHGANIINMSFGKAYSPQKSVVDDAVKYADERGVLLVHAAGNDAKDLATESNFPNRNYTAGGSARNWIEVGASHWGGTSRLAADFSNYGRAQVDVFAPGTDIKSASPGNAYESASGTSFAAPVVSGVAALLMVYYPDLTAADVKRIILESAIPVREQMVLRPGEEELQIRFGDLSTTGAIVNAYRAVKMAESMPRR
jgi:subtilisin family serine protease